MGEVVSKNVLAWARDLATVRKLLDAPRLAMEPLQEIGRRHGTDKANPGRTVLEVYDANLSSRRNDELTLIEDVARRAALALETADTFREQSGRLANVIRVADAAQRAILAPPPPKIGPVRLAARYVSGYLETDPPPGQPKLQGADASHAWCSVYVPPFGWVDIDPTNDQLPPRRPLGPKPPGPPGAPGPPCGVASYNVCWALVRIAYNAASALALIAVSWPLSVPNVADA